MTLTATQTEVVTRIKAAGLRAYRYAPCVVAARMAHDKPMSITQAAQLHGVSRNGVSNAYRRLYGTIRRRT